MPAKLLRFSQSSALSAAACLCIAATPAKAEPWRSSVELYGPVPLRLDTTTTVVTQNNRSVTTEAVLNLGQVLDNLQWITAVRGSVEKGRWGVLTDLSYTKLGQEDGATTPNGLLTGRASVDVSQGIYDLAVRYRFGEPEAAVGTPGQFSLIPYAGIRVIDAQMDVAAQVDLGNILSVQRQGNFGRTWAQPLLGTQASLFLSPRLRAFARADIGGFGLGGAKDLSGNAQIGLGYAVGNSTDLNISWRYFGLDYNNGDNPDSGFSSYQNGLEIGLKFFF
jgi:predicted porin